MIKWFSVVVLLLGISTWAVAQQSPADFLEAEVDNLTPYVGEPIMFTWRWYLGAATSANASSANIQLPDFTGFGQETLPDTEPQSRLINGQQYQVVTQQIMLYPLQSGAITVNPLRINTPETPFAAASLLETAPLTVNVQPLPANAPASFKNAVGQFALSAAVAPATGAQAGQPLSLRVTLTGSGNIAQVLAPALVLPENWRVYEQAPRYEQSTPQVGARIFEWTLIPLQGGVQTIPAIELSYFTPATGTYQTLQTAPMTLDVQGGSGASQTTSIASTPLSTVSNSLPLKPLPAVLSNSLPVPAPLFWALWAMPPIILAGVWFSGRRRTQQPTPTRKITGSKALQQAQARLKATQTLKPKAMSEQIGVTIYGYVSAKTGKAMQRDMLAEALKSLPVDARKRLMQCLEQAEAARYAPVTGDEVLALLKETSAALTQVDQLWKK